MTAGGEDDSVSVEASIFRDENDVTKRSLRPKMIETQKNLDIGER